MRLSICIGQYAQIPYCVPGVDINVYSMEELCYCIRENSYLIDSTLMNDDLLSWIDRECGLRSLAKTLYSYVHRRGVLSSFVTAIFQYVGLYDHEEIEKLEKVLQQGAGLNRYERKKAQIDFLVKKKKYLHAIKEYDSMLAQWKQEESEGEVMPSGRCLASIYHNKGVALAGMMLYKSAAISFCEAYKLDARGDYLKDFLACKRMELSDQEYIAFAATIPEALQVTLMLEKEMELLNEQWCRQADYLRVKQRRELRDSIDKQKYFEESDLLTQSLKNNYRNIIAE